jgi:hypothetical protein
MFNDLLSQGRVTQQPLFRSLHHQHSSADPFIVSHQLQMQADDQCMERSYPDRPEPNGSRFDKQTFRLRTSLRTAGAVEVRPLPQSNRLSRNRVGVAWRTPPELSRSVVTFGGVATSAAGADAELAFSYPYNRLYHHLSWQVQLLSFSLTAENGFNT